jgi:hypothetical protein
MSKILRFTFCQEQGREEVEGDLALAIFAAECIHGRPRVRLETRYLVGAGGQTCVMEVSGPAGESAAQVFTGLATARFGEEAVSIAHHQEQPLEVGGHEA